MKLYSRASGATFFVIAFVILSHPCNEDLIMVDRQNDSIISHKHCMLYLCCWAIHFAEKHNTSLLSAPEKCSLKLYLNLAAS